MDLDMSDKDSWHAEAISSLLLMKVLQPAGAAGGGFSL